MNDDRAGDPEAKRPRRRLRPAKFNDIDPATAQLATYFLLAVGIFVLLPHAELSEAKEEFSRFIGAVILIGAVASLAYRRWGASSDIHRR